MKPQVNAKSDSAVVTHRRCTRMPRVTGERQSARDSCVTVATMLSMRRIINGKAYDTNTAELIARGDHDHELSQASWSLYRTRNAAYFEVYAGHDGVVESFRPCTDTQAPISVHSVIAVINPPSISTSDNRSKQNEPANINS
jgi:hypothetical protein